MELPFEDNSFDYVTIGFGLRNVPDYKQVLSEMNRVAKPGGMVVCLRNIAARFETIQCVDSDYISVI